VSTSETSTSETKDPTRAFTETGRRAWAFVGIAVALAIVAVVLSRFSVVLIAAGLALFPAAVLSPASLWLQRHRVPGAVAALLLMAAVFGFFALVVRLLAPRFMDQAPALVDSLQGSVRDLQDLLAEQDLVTTLPDPGDLGQTLLDGAGGAGGAVGQGLGVAVSFAHVVTGILILLVTLFFLLKDGPAIWRGIADLVPDRARRDVEQVGGQVWWTLGSFFRGQLLVALFDAVFIGLGLLVLGVPLALPLAVLVFLGGLFPIVGAFVSGLIAVLVALADQGLGKALLVLGLVVVVQQVESNVLEPLILSKVIALHPLVVLLAVAGGALAFGVLGAFLAVPLWAAAARVVDHLRGRRPPAGPAAKDPDLETARAT
jgi:predicted PurR-regulated permease PerM